MKGNPKVLEHLNLALRDELTAINQYFLHAEMAENWGYKKYSKYIKKQSIDEMKHAEMLMERILFLDGLPKMEPMSLTIGKSVKEMVESDLELEHEAVASYNTSIAVCVENADNGSRDQGDRLRAISNYPDGRGLIFPYVDYQVRRPTGLRQLRAKSRSEDFEQQADRFTA